MADTTFDQVMGHMGDLKTLSTGLRDAVVTGVQHAQAAKAQIADLQNQLANGTHVTQEQLNALDTEMTDAITVGQDALTQAGSL
jgi:predicted  nucleic acid-binding Zn-ribbon protein